ncbi:MAG TPA: MAPEG family protein [Rhizomicrobium sp.]|nr:MAPEG family protein [Rhizomicrobium sp.]
MGNVFASAYNSFFLYVGINAFVMLVLGMLVVRARVKTRTEIGDGGGKPEMTGPLRAHANNTEYVPMALLLMWCLVPLGANVWLVHGVGAPLTIGRIVHAIGLSRSTGVSAWRFAGILLTWLSYVVGIVAVLWLVFFPTVPAS